MKITTALQERLICPRCRSRLYPRGESFMGRRPAEAPAPERVAALQPQNVQEKAAQEQPAQSQATPAPPLAPVQVPQYQGLIRTDVRAWR